MFCKTKNSGFTLIELLVTLLVSTLVIGAVLVSLIYSVILDEYNEKFSIAMNIARGRLEAVISERSNFDSISNDSGTLSVENDGIEGSWQVRIYRVPGYTDDLMKIRVAVCWRGRGGRIVGGDLDLDGEIDGTDDFITTGDFSGGFKSPCVLTTALAKR